MSTPVGGNQDKRKAILLLGSNNIADLISESVDSIGCRMIVSDSADEVSFILAHHDIRIAAMLIQIPRDDPADTALLQYVRQIPETDFIPVIAVVGSRDHGVECVRKGACDFVFYDELSGPALADRIRKAVGRTDKDIESTACFVEILPENPDFNRNMLRYVSYAKIAQALSGDYLCIYYIDTESDRFVEYSSSEEYRKLGIQKQGEGFFKASSYYGTWFVHPDDKQIFVDALKKDRLLSELDNYGSSTAIFRLRFGDGFNYVSMKAYHMADKNDPHIVLSFRNIQTEMKRQQENLTYSSISKALAADYFSIYYVDTDTDQFIEYSASGDSQELDIEKGREDFFNLSLKNLKKAVYPEDQPKVAAALNKEYLLSELNKYGSFTLTYRLMFASGPTYVRMKAIRMEDKDDPHIVIGVNNVEAEMRRKQESITFSNIALALAADYFSIYFVDTENDSFIEFSSSDRYLDLGIEKEGSDFFALSKRNIKRVIYHEDRDIVIKAMDKDYLLRELSENGSFTLTYRLVFEEKPIYVSMKATRMKDERYIVIGISNADAQMRREHELYAAKELANRDALTGVKSKHAFVEAESQVNKRLKEGTQEPFALVVCDLNGLKIINDTMGHNAGDKYIKDAADIICHTFQHSPVFRTGGDEFVAIVSGDDYAVREKCFESLQRISLNNLGTSDVVIACGMADHRPGDDNLFEDVFNRADSRMYENKKALKGQL